MGRSPSCSSDGLKKGAWTLEEDHKLISYVQKHGEGGWRSLPQKAGKSSHLIYHLNSSASFSCGNVGSGSEDIMWATIAKQFPRRTDHEIKNYWHAHLKKRLAKTCIDPTTTGRSSSSGTTVTAANPKTDTECVKPQPSEPKTQRSASTLLLNKLATRVTQCVGLLQSMPFNGNGTFSQPFSSCAAAQSSDNNITDSLTTPETGNAIDEGVLNDITASEFSSFTCVDGINDWHNNNDKFLTGEIQVDNQSDSVTVNYYEGLWDDDAVDDHMIFDTVGSLGFYDSNLFSSSDVSP
ncbi:transcription factor MYB28-like [Hibiscus syriacus]|uniref:transcription factor MYB28-like n=1 Tax=Hibiscus syriacus TaxID=106335 RepID=UPI0019240009|nr:transcription factor MYB28-like [Hibiscus syriacus]